MTVERDTVRVKHHDYLPGKAEPEKPFAIRKSDGTMPTLGEPARAALRPVNAVEDPDA